VLSFIEIRPQSKQIVACEMC